MNIRRNLDSYKEESRSRFLGSATVRSARAGAIVKHCGLPDPGG